jgi:hypothetical protein
MMWLLYREQTDGCHIRHGSAGRDTDCLNYLISAWKGFYAEIKNVSEYNGCYWYGHSCQPIRDVPTLAHETLPERYEKTMANLAKITEAGYHVEVQFECEFDKWILDVHPELETHPIVQHEPLNTRDALYGGRTEDMRLHYKVAEGETIQ